MSLPGDFRSGGLASLRKMGQRFFSRETKGNVKAQPIPAHVGMERRSGRRVSLPLEVRVKVGDKDAQKAKLRDVNMSGLALETAGTFEAGDRLSVGFDGYPGVSPGFALVAVVRRRIPGTEAGESDALGLEIDRERTSADAQKNYRRLVRHYLHHRPLLDDRNQAYFDARCKLCGWVGRVGRRNPLCPRCRGRVVPVAETA